MSQTILDIQNLKVSFTDEGRRLDALKGISYQVDKGEVVCLVGESGSGKSVSALAAIGLLPANATVEADKLNFDGNDLKKIDAEAFRRLRGSQMSMIFQEPMTSLNPVFKVGHQVEEVLEIHTKLNKKDRKNKVLELFRIVEIDHPERRYHAYPNQLSGGQRQRVMIAMALATETKLLIADEPTTALDVTVQGKILDLLRGLIKRFDMSVLFITHDFGVVEALGDRVVVMEQGLVVEEGTVQRVMENPQHPYTKKLLAAMPKFAPRQSIAQEGTPLLEVRNLEKHFHVRSGGFLTKPEVFKAVNNVTFDLFKGETLGVVGESGCGKSTLARCLIGLYQHDAGSVLFNGQEVGHLKGRTLKAMRRQMQMVFQDPFSSLNPRMRIGESVGEGLRAHGLMPSQEREAFVKMLLRDCGLPEESYYRFPHQFSGGQRQRICIARALSLKPDLIIADEAVSALDVSVQKQILELLADLKDKYNLSYLFISHDLRVVSEVADRVIVMLNGEIVEQGLTSEVFGHPSHTYTQHLLASIPGKPSAGHP